jgi:hypothetical protein
VLLREVFSLTFAPSFSETTRSKQAAFHSECQLKSGAIEEFFIIIFHHEFRPGWPVSVSAVISSSSLLSGLPGRRLPFGRIILLGKYEKKRITFVTIHVFQSQFLDFFLHRTSRYSATLFISAPPKLRLAGHIRPAKVFYTARVVIYKKNAKLNTDRLLGGAQRHFNFCTCT